MSLPGSPSSQHSVSAQSGCVALYLCPLLILKRAHRNLIRKKLKIFRVLPASVQYLERREQTKVEAVGRRRRRSRVSCDSGLSFHLSRSSTASIASQALRCIYIRPMIVRRLIFIFWQIFCTGRIFSRFTERLSH